VMGPSTTLYLPSPLPPHIHFGVPAPVHLVSALVHYSDVQIAHCPRLCWPGPAVGLVDLCMLLASGSGLLSAVTVGLDAVTMGQEAFIAG
jgi:hypothetical protein